MTVRCLFFSGTVSMASWSVLKSPLPSAATTIVFPPEDAVVVGAPLVPDAAITVATRNSIDHFIISHTPSCSQQELDRLAVEAVHHQDGVEQQPGARRQRLAEDQADEEGFSALEQRCATEAHDQQLGQPPDEDAEPCVLDECAADSGD